MASQKDQSHEREYIIPLRRAVMKAARYDRSRIALRTIKRFIARHMRVAERDFSKIKLDVNLNNEIWYRGRKSPPAKIKVKAVKENDIVKVGFVEEPSRVLFHKNKMDKRHVAPLKKPVKQKKEKEVKELEEKKVEQTIDEKEKEKSVAEVNEKIAEANVKAEKHTTKGKDPKIFRKSLKK